MLQPPSWTKLSTEETRLAKMWYNDGGKSPSEIAALLHRDKSSLTRLLDAELERRPDGRLKAFTETQVDAMVKKLEDMILEANQEHRVTAGDLKNRMRLKSTTSTILKALHERGAVCPHLSAPA